MNKCICAAALLCGSALSAHAQIKAGTVLLGGGLNFSNARTESSSSPAIQTTKSKSTQFSLVPQAGYFLADNLMLGFEASYTHSSSKQEGFDYLGTLNTFTGKGNGYRLGPLVRYYKMVSDNAGFFGQVAAGYSSGHSETEGTNSYAATDKSKGGYAFLMPGFVYFPLPKLGLEATFGSVGYSKSTWESSATSFNPQEPARTSKNTESGFGATFALSSLSLGAAFYLGR
ncbi:outer membrane protein with beta-barrel domain [Hymenobacter chitinivorans DSM 11115]|uniref:Outer membrane protein with beta-barrel domain n=2 Tax=Hymenobacter chitinivorans TaxID=89969 RepID=A0A2M9ARS3_9BACT|nr:outer membrane protein with beta-barrel domain [Hymenobacter chitinivorans DSM 11115]